MNTLAYKEFLIESAKDLENIADENKNGKCYEIALDYFLKNCFKNKDLRLCHGLVTGQGPIKGIVYCHAWCEDMDYVYDFSGPLTDPISADLYYYIGKIDPKTVFIYDRNQVQAKMTEFKTYGPWEDVLLKNKF